MRKADRNAPPHQRQHAQREGDVGGDRHRPALQRAAVPVDRQVDHRRRGHAAQRPPARQHPPPPRGELPVQELALDLQPDQQKNSAISRSLIQCRTLSGPT
jgi:hypothetical protein